MSTPTSILNEVQRLTWALIDEAATDAELQRLEELLAENEEGREVYIRCVQLHANLREFFARESSPAARPAIVPTSSSPTGATTPTSAQ